MNNGIVFESIKQTITVDGSFAEDAIKKFFNDCAEDPGNFRVYLKDLFMTGVTVGMKHAGLQVNGYVEKEKNEELEPR